MNQKAKDYIRRNTLDLESDNRMDSTGYVQYAISEAKAYAAIAIAEEGMRQKAIEAFKFAVDGYFIIGGTDYSADRLNEFIKKLESYLDIYMRMIKFRAKRVNGGEWVKSMTISYGTIKRKMYNVFFEVEPNKWVGVIPETVCQFSEITDKNGNSIFEHDLILIHESESSYQFTVEVLFHKGMFCYKNKACGFTPLWYVSDRCEVIGNAFDNPELMKEGVQP